MICNDIIKGLEAYCPPELAVEWDHSGLQVGDTAQEITKILVALDATDEMIEQAHAKGAEFLLTHHPMLFHPPVAISEQDHLGRRIRKLIRYNITNYAMHTNFDVGGMAEINATDLILINTQILQPTCIDAHGVPQGFGRVGDLAEAVTLESFADMVKKAAGLQTVRVYGDPRMMVSRVAVMSGAGKSNLADAVRTGAHVFVTGDVDYHTGLDGIEQGVAVIDAGHYGTEYVFIRYMEQKIRELFPDIAVICAQVRQPYVLL